MSPEQHVSKTERIAELEREIADLESQLNSIGLCSLEALRSELSRLRNEGEDSKTEEGRDARGLLQTALDLFELTDACQEPGSDAYTWRYHASDYLNGNDNLTGEAGRDEREALERMAIAIHKARYANPMYSREAPPLENEPSASREYVYRLARAALSQGNGGEAVGWEAEAEFWCRLFGRAVDALDVVAGNEDEDWNPEEFASSTAEALRGEFAKRPIPAAPSSPPEGAAEKGDAK